ncbi:Bgt-2801 [Blumeria graminis f. sp. tritici]|uniref:Bgt-2801 n=2 Tax=Blumeria graminis f. sp. tritici TaxID=62690 RepID=A0A061HHV8_BLUGR|nr:hypothetical protein BGT96224_2801 [Blumeria graminis f. sp. tritici 96224]VCU39579.1 Bgt-2801 [Blumeria graminis f. sp. tritici]
MVKLDATYEYLTEEEKRLKQDRDREKYWKKWGPYVAERQWATGQPPAFYFVSIFLMIMLVQELLGGVRMELRESLIPMASKTLHSHSGMKRSWFQFSSAFVALTGSQ